jgi:hypothetical protein
MSGKPLALALALAVVAAAAPALARDVYLNGVDVSALRNQIFKNVTVSIDADGDIHMDAPGYKVEVVDPSAAEGRPPAKADEGGPNPLLAQRYYLVTAPTPGDKAQYDLAVSVNGVERRRIRNGSGQVIMEISAWLQRGDNAIEISAVKNLTDGRKSASPSDRLDVLVGVGHEEGSIVKIDGVKVEFKCDASQIETVKRRYTLKAN